MENKQWPFSPKEARQVGVPTNKEDIRLYHSNFNNLAKSGELDKCFDTPFGKRQGEFFGRDRIAALLHAADESASKNNGECVGIRMYYGLAFEEIDPDSGACKISTKCLKEEVIRPRIFLVGVDQNGEDIEIDMAQMKDARGDGLGGGVPQPPYGNN